MTRESISWKWSSCYGQFNEEYGKYPINYGSLHEEYGDKSVQF